jgi:hypothetical protein
MLQRYDKLSMVIDRRLLLLLLLLLLLFGPFLASINFPQILAFTTSSQFCFQKDIHIFPAKANLIPKVLLRLRVSIF